jgi:hypothetical protein
MPVPAGASGDFDTQTVMPSAEVRRPADQPSPGGQDRRGAGDGPAPADQKRQGPEAGGVEVLDTPYAPVDVRVTTCPRRRAASPRVERPPLCFAPWSRPGELCGLSQACESGSRFPRPVRPLSAQ